MSHALNLRAFWALEVLSPTYAGVRWTQTGLFPRTTTCTVPARAIGISSHTFTVQCVLPLNMFNELIFLLFWLWLTFLFFLNTANLMYWLYISFAAAPKKAFLDHLMPQVTCRTSSARLDKLALFLDRDAMTTLRLTAENCGDDAAISILGQLWSEAK